MNTKTAEQIARKHIANGGCPYCGDQNWDDLGISQLDVDSVVSRHKCNACERHFDLTYTINSIVVDETDDEGLCIDFPVTE